jgi:hypothetical protein
LVGCIVFYYYSSFERRGKTHISIPQEPKATSSRRTENRALEAKHGLTPLTLGEALRSTIADELMGQPATLGFDSLGITDYADLKDAVPTAFASWAACLHTSKASAYQPVGKREIRLARNVIAP